MLEGNPAAKREEARATSGAGFEERDKALYNLVDIMMGGGAYPKRKFGQIGQPQVCLEDLIQEFDNLEVGALIAEEITKGGMGEILRAGLRKMAEEYLVSSQWHDMMIEETELDAAYNRECGDD
jgi:hypothetical protein